MEDVERQPDAQEVGEAIAAGAEDEGVGPVADGHRKAGGGAKSHGHGESAGGGVEVAGQLDGEWHEQRGDGREGAKVGEDGGRQHRDAQHDRGAERSGVVR